MKLRKKTKYEIDSYLKMFDIRKNSFSVLTTLQDLYKREQIKLRQNLVDQAIFETQFESMLKERGTSGALISQQIQTSKVAANQQQLLRKIEAKQDYKSLPVQIPETKAYHKMFLRYLPQEERDRLYPPV